MADDNEHAETDTSERSRRQHAPEHASGKHERHAQLHTQASGQDAYDEALPDTNDDTSVVMADADEQPAHFSGLAAVPSGPHHKLWHWLSSHKKVSVPGAIVLLLAVLLAIPFTRYMLVGTVLRKDFSVTVVDSQTHKPISSATVLLADKTATTNNKGIATVHANVGNATVTVSKKYYSSTKKAVLVPIGSQKQKQQVSLVATGRQVPITVTNKITGQPVANVAITAQGTEAKTDAKGEVILVVPANKATVEASLKATAYNLQKVTIKVTAGVDAANKFQVTPSGKLYFLSNKSGNIDVVKTNLDGTDRQIVLAGTGKEDKNNTVLLASQDWQYLALLSNRDGGDHAKLFLVNTSDDSTTTMDEGNATFNLVGWSGHRFIYSVDRSYEQWQPNRQALKSYDASAAKNITLDQTAAAGNAGGYFSENLSNVFIYSGDEIVYGKNVVANSGNDAKGHDSSINSVKANGDDKHAIKSWSFVFPYTYYGFVTNNANMRVYAPNEVYAANSIYPDQATKDDTLYEYEDGKLTDVAGKKASNIYDGDYFTYLLSPSDAKSFWSETRDGKNTLFVGNNEGKDPKEVASLSEYQTYGWFTEKYLLVSKNSSELYILPVGGGTPLKITDYYKPNVSFTGYGKGYGGI